MDKHLQSIQSIFDLLKMIIFPNNSNLPSKEIRKCMPDCILSNKMWRKKQGGKSFYIEFIKGNPFSKWITFILYEFTLNFICNWNEKNKTKIQTIQNTKENCWNSVNGIIFVCFFCMILFIFIQAFANNKIRTNFAQHFKLSAFLYMNHWWIALNSLLLHLNPFDFPKTSTFEPLHASFHQKWWIDITQRKYVFTLRIDSQSVVKQ